MIPNKMVWDHTTIMTGLLVSWEPMIPDRLMTTVEAVKDSNRFGLLLGSLSKAAHPNIAVIVAVTSGIKSDNNLPTPTFQCAYSFLDLAS